MPNDRAIIPELSGPDDEMSTTYGQRMKSAHSVSPTAGMMPSSVFKIFGSSSLTSHTTILPSEPQDAYNLCQSLYVHIRQTTLTRIVPEGCHDKLRIPRLCPPSSSMILVVSSRSIILIANSLRSLLLQAQ